jgi:hypothetical protein
MEALVPSIKNIPKDQDLALIKEGNIYYIVMNKDDNTFTDEWDKRFNDLLD